MYYIFVYLARNTLKQIKTVSELEKIPGRGREKKFMAYVPPSPHFLATPLIIIIVKKFNKLSSEKPTSCLSKALSKTVASRFDRLRNKIREQQSNENYNRIGLMNFHVF